MISPPQLHCKIDQFHLGRIRIPESMATNQLESRVKKSVGSRGKSTSTMN